jgi:hypothetical protein
LTGRSRFTRIRPTADSAVSFCRCWAWFSTVCLSRNKASAVAPLNKQIWKHDIGQLGGMACEHRDIGQLGGLAYEHRDNALVLCVLFVYLLILSLFTSFVFLPTREDQGNICKMTNKGSLNIPITLALTLFPCMCWMKHYFSIYLCLLTFVNAFPSLLDLSICCNAHVCSVHSSVGWSQTNVDLSKEVHSEATLNAPRFEN